MAVSLDTAKQTSKERQAVLPETRAAWERVRAYNNGWNHGHITRETSNAEQLKRATRKAWRDYQNANDSLERRYYQGVWEALQGFE